MYKTYPLEKLQSKNEIEKIDAHSEEDDGFAFLVTPSLNQGSSSRTNGELDSFDSCVSPAWEKSEADKAFEALVVEECDAPEPWDELRCLTQVSKGDTKGYLALVDLDPPFDPSFWKDELRHETWQSLRCMAMRSGRVDDSRELDRFASEIVRRHHFGEITASAVNKWLVDFRFARLQAVRRRSTSRRKNVKDRFVPVPYVDNYSRRPPPPPVLEKSVLVRDTLKYFSHEIDRSKLAELKGIFTTTKNRPLYKSLVNSRLLSEYQREFDRHVLLQWKFRELLEVALAPKPMPFVEVEPTPAASRKERRPVETPSCFQAPIPVVEEEESMNIDELFSEVPSSFVEHESHAIVKGKWMVWPQDCFMIFDELPGKYPEFFGDDDEDSIGYSMRRYLLPVDVVGHEVEPVWVDDTWFYNFAVRHPEFEPHVQYFLSSVKRLFTLFWLLATSFHKDDVLGNFRDVLVQELPRSDEPYMSIDWEETFPFLRAVTAYVSMRLIELYGEAHFQSPSAVVTQVALNTLIMAEESTGLPVGEALSVKVIQRIAQASALLFNLCDDIPIRNKVNSVVIFLAGFNLGTMVEFVQNWWEVNKSLFQGAAWDAVEALMGIVGVANIFATLADVAGGQRTTPLEFLRARFTSLSRMQQGDDKIKKFWCATQALFTTLKECFDLKSLDPLWTRECSPKGLLVIAEALTTHQKSLIGLGENHPNLDFDRLRREGALPPEWTRPFLPSEFEEYVRTIKGRLDAIIPLVSAGEGMLLRGARDRIHQMEVANAGSYASNSMRPQPLGIVLTGEPGIGKTNLSNKIFSHVARMMKFSSEDRARYSWMASANFQEINPQHWFVSMDDLDFKNVVEAPGVKSHVDAYMEVIDNKPAPVESAAVEQKGTNYMRPLMVVATTNNDDLKIRARISDPNAVYRRLGIKAIVRGRAEFCTNGTIDFTKCKGRVDVHDLHVYEFSMVARDYVFKKIMGDREFLDYVVMRFKDHMADQQGVLRRSDERVCDCGRLLEPEEEQCNLCPTITVRPLRVDSGDSVRDQFFMEHDKFQGPNASKFSLTESISVVGEASAAAGDLLSDVNEKQLVAKAEDTLDEVRAAARAVRHVVEAPGRAVSAVQESAMSLGDLVCSKWGLGIAAVLGVGIAVMATVSVVSPFQGRTDNRAQILPLNYIRTSEKYPDGPKFKDVTYTRDQLLTAVRSNYATVTSGILKDAHSLRVGGDLFLIHGHYFQTLTDHGILVARMKTLELSFGGLSYTVPLNEHTLTQFGRSDLYLLRVAGVPASPQTLSYFWPDIDERFTTFDAIEIIGPDFIKKSTTNCLADEIYGGYTQIAVASDLGTVNGDCGLAVVAQVGNAFRIVGIHHLRDKTQENKDLQTCAVVVTSAEIRRRGVALGGVVHDASIVKELFPSPFQCSPLKDSTKSELSLALDRGAHVVNRGHLDSWLGSSQDKSKCKRSTYYDDVEAFGKHYLGVDRYWQVPNMKGGMVEGKGWVSGYQHLFAHYSPHEAHEHLYGAVLDYIRDIDECEGSSYAALSETEALIGVESSLINAVNLATSIGPPSSGPKKNFVSLAGGTAPCEREKIDAINACLDLGQIPLVPGACTLKDEPVKNSKNKEHNIRVFTTCPFAWNFVAKQYLAPIQIFMRQNPFVTESMVGINMSGNGGSRVLRHLEQVDPDLQNVVEGDYTKMDKTIGGSLVWAVTQVFIHIAEKLGIDPLKVELLVLSAFNMIYSIKGDLFQVGGMNPSGCAITVEINAIANSLCQRAAWLAYHGVKVSREDFVRRRPSPLRFSDHCACVTYGDDFLIAHRERLDLTRLFAAFAPLGMIVTDGQKLAKPVYRAYTEVSFLKRTFVREGPFVYCGLDPKSILRMLLIWKKSDLSDRDHGGIVLEEALREVFLRRELDFDHWRAFLRGLADKYGLWTCSYLKLHSRETYHQAWLDGSFTTWDLSKG